MTEEKSLPKQKKPPLNIRVFSFVRSLKYELK